MERTIDPKRWTILGVVLVVLLVALGLLAGSCRSTEGGQAAPAAGGGPSAEALAGLTDPGASTSAAVEGSATVPTPSTTSSADSATIPTRPTTSLGDSATVASGPTSLSDSDCAALEQVVIPAAAIITEDDFTPVEQRQPELPHQEAAAVVVERVAVIVPADHRAAWRGVAAQVALAEKEGRPPTDEERARLRAARNGVEVWARSVCPDAPPSWECDHFGSQGPGPDVAPATAEAPTPEQVLRAIPDSGRTRELQRTTDIVLRGWLDGRGFVVRTVQIERVDDGWAVARRHVCHGAR